MFRSNQKILLTLSLLGCCGWATAEVRLSSLEAQNAATVKPPPAYPVIARQLHITGRVEVEVKIDEQGHVGDIKMLSGNALFSQTIVETLKRWRFLPSLQKGIPTTAIALLSFVFEE